MADPREQRSLASTVTTAADIGIAAIARDRAEPGPGVGRSDPGHALPTLSSPSQGQGDRPPRDRRRAATRCDRSACAHRAAGLVAWTGTVSHLVEHRADESNQVQRRESGLRSDRSPKPAPGL